LVTARFTKQSEQIPGSGNTTEAQCTKQSDLATPQLVWLC